VLPDDCACRRRRPWRSRDSFAGAGSGVAFVPPVGFGGWTRGRGCRMLALRCLSRRRPSLLRTGVCGRRRRRVIVEPDRTVAVNHDKPDHRRRWRGDFDQRRAGDKHVHRSARATLVRRSSGRRPIRPNYPTSGSRPRRVDSPASDGRIHSATIRRGTLGGRAWRSGGQRRRGRPGRGAARRHAGASGFVPPVTRPFGHLRRGAGPGPRLGRRPGTGTRPRTARRRRTWLTHIPLPIGRRRRGLMAAAVRMIVTEAVVARVVMAGSGARLRAIGRPCAVVVTAVVHASVVERLALLLGAITNLGSGSVGIVAARSAETAGSAVPVDRAAVGGVAMKPIEGQQIAQLQGFDDNGRSGASGGACSDACCAPARATPMARTNRQPGAGSPRAHGPSHHWSSFMSPDPGPPPWLPAPRASLASELPDALPSPSAAPRLRPRRYCSPKAAGNSHLLLSANIFFRRQVGKSFPWGIFVQPRGTNPRRRRVTAAPSRFP
jgi:hypothetical protein